MSARPAISFPLRWQLWCGCLLALLLLVLGGARGAMLEGLWTPVRIVGPSMAPTLVGVKTQVVCHACRFPITVGGEHSTPAIVCPNCGRSQSGEQTGLSTPGQRVVIDRWPLLWRAPRRMELVAWETDEGLAVKRVVGLPGEQLAIRGGELFRNDQLWQKTLAEHRVLSQLVHDDRYSVDHQSTWRCEPAEAASFDASQSTHTLSPTEETAWLTFHQPVLQQIPNAAEHARVTDIDLYNVDNSRTINDVFDVRIIGRIELDTPGAIIWRMHDGWYEWRIEIDSAQGKLSLFQDDNSVAFRSAKLAEPAGAASDQNATFAPRKATLKAFDFEAAIFDQQIFLVIDGKTRLEHSYAAPETPRELGDAKAIGLGIAKASAKITGLRVYRDIYWLDPLGLNRPWEAETPLGKNECFLLGDNVPVSTDSRHLGPALRSQLRGVVRPWFLAR